MNEPMIRRDGPNRRFAAEDLDAARPAPAPAPAPDRLEPARA
jgi:hypothetical protein